MYLLCISCMRVGLHTFIIPHNLFALHHSPILRYHSLDEQQSVPDLSRIQSRSQIKCVPLSISIFQIQFKIFNCMKKLTNVANDISLFQAKLFFKARVVTKGCSCGEAVVVSLQKAIPFANITLTTPANLQNYIEANGIGCIRKTMRTGTSSKTCVHIKHAAIPDRVLKIIVPTIGILM